MLVRERTKMESEINRTERRKKKHQEKAEKPKVYSLGKEKTSMKLTSVQADVVSQKEEDKQLLKSETRVGTFYH